MTPLQDWIVPVTVDGEHIALTGDKAIDTLRGVFHLPDFRTGTATRRTEQVILNSLRLSLEETKVIRQPSNRPTLLFHVVAKKADGKEAIVSLVKKEFPEQCGIIYCVERKDTIDIVYY